MTDLSVAKKLVAYKPKNKVRFVTAAALFDGHDASINIMRRILQSTGSEVIHLGHNRSVGEIVNAALQEDVQGIAITSYQGGHVEFFKYMIDLLRENGGENIKVFGGGGGVIVPAEIKELHDYGVTRIYSPEDGAVLGLQGMINDLVERCDEDLSVAVPKGADTIIAALKSGDRRALARVITGLENGAYGDDVKQALIEAAKSLKVPALGITGTGGAGKSSLTDELVRRFRLDQEDKLKLAIISIDPSRKRTGGALLGDRIRMNAIEHPNIFMRSLATRDTGKEVSAALPEVIAATRLAGFDMVIVETSGIGQGDAAIVPFVDVSLYVMTPEFGAASQLEKIDMLDFADFVAINKFDRKGAEDALRDVRKQYQRNRELFTTPPTDAGVRHHGRPLQRRRRDRAVPGPCPGAGGQGPQAQGKAKLPIVSVKASSRGRAIVPADRVPATWPRSPTRCAATTSTPPSRPAWPANARPCASPRRCFEGCKQGRRLLRRADRLEGRRADRLRQEAARHVAEDRRAVRGRRIRGEDPRQGNPHRPHLRVAVRQQDPQGCPADATRTTARPSSS
jgi:methylmalonyl-CoA mutase